MQKELQPYWSFRDDIAIVDGIAMKILVLSSLQSKALNTGIEKTRLMACESIYWVNMNAGIEETVKNFSHT